MRRIASTWNSVVQSTLMMNHPVVGRYFDTLNVRYRYRVVLTSKFQLDVAINHVCNRVVTSWNYLPECIVTTDSVAHFKQLIRTVNFESAVQQAEYGDGACVSRRPQGQQGSACESRRETLLQLSLQTVLQPQQQVCNSQQRYALN